MKKHLFILLLSLYSMLHVPSSVHAQVPSYVPTSGLVGWWPFNGNANDESGNGNNGTVNGATLTTDRFGVANKAIYNNSNPQYLSFPNGASTVLNLTNDFSFGYWVKTSVINSNNGFLSFGDNVASAPLAAGIVSGLMNAGKLGVGIRGTWYQSNAYVNNNVWRFVCVTYESGTLKFFIDGILDSQFTGIPNPLSWNGNRTFGCRSDLFMNSNTNYIGYVDDIAIYNRALTQQEITNLYTSSATPSIATSASPTLINCGESATLTASSTVPIQSCFSNDLPVSLQNGLVGYWPFCGNTLDGSSNGNNGTINGSLYSIDRFGSQSASLEITDGLQIMCTNNLMNNPNQFSISLWFNSSNTTSTSPEGLGRIFGFDNGQCQHIFNQDRYIDIMTNGKIRFHINHTSGNYFIYSNPGKNDGNWHNVVCTFGADGMKLYVDGNMEDSNPNSSISSYNGYWRIGGLNDSYSPSFIGKVDDVALYNRAITPTEIQQLYTLANVNYSWSTGATTPSITVSPAQTSSYTCTATNSAGSTTSSVTVTVADSLSWTGLFDTDWHKPCNWSPQFVPKCCNNVLIPVTSNQPIVSGVAAAEDLTIYTTNGAQLTVNNGANLQIADCPTTITTTACPSLAVLTTTAVSSVTLSTAISGGTITYQGESAITARGICWSTSQNPTIANSFTTNGTGVGTFTSNLTGLTAGTTYYVRAYATNASGTSYGNEVSFTTSSPLLLGQNYQGGTIVYLLQAGDPGYDAANQHGLIVYPSLLGPAEWGCYGTQLNVFNTAYGTGNNNTYSIVAACANASYAAKICYNLSANGYSDWYLPSKEELNKVYLQRFNLAFLNNSVGYWSSSETAMNTAYGQLFAQSQASSSVSVSKTTPYYVVAVRNF